MKCVYCGGAAHVNRRNRNGTVYYRCPSCGKYFTGEAPELGGDGELSEGPIDDRIRQNRVVLKKRVTTGKGDRGRPTLQYLLEVFEVDETVFEVESYRINQWEMGFVGKDRTPGSYPLYQCKVWLRRRMPITIEIPAPPIIRLQVALPAAPWIKVGVGNTTKALFASDFHIGYVRDLKTGQLYPYHDRRAIDIMIQVARSEDIDLLILGGDVLDIPEFTGKFPRTPDQFFTLRPALVETKWMLARLRLELPNTRIVWLEGNHEIRLPNYTRDNMIAAYELTGEDEIHQLISLPYMLGLDELGIEWVGGYPDAEIWLTDTLRATHGNIAKSAPGQTGLTYLRKANCSTIYGHIHNREQVARTEHEHDGAQDYYAMCPGMMGLPRQVPASRKNHDWQQGFGLISWEAGASDFAWQVVGVRGGRSLLRGVVYEGEDYIDQLRMDTGWLAFAAAA